MELRRTPARRAGLVAVAALLAFGATACSGGTGLVGTPPAATVNGHTISQTEVTSATDATRRFYEDTIAQGQDTDGTLAALVPTLQGSSDSVGAEGAAGVLTDLIKDQVLRDALAEHDALPTADDRKELRSSLESQIGAEQLKKVDKEYLDLYLERKSLDDAFQAWAAEQANQDIEPYTQAERDQLKQAYFEQNFADRPLCINVIQTSTEEEAASAKARVDGGEDFVTVARSFVPEGVTLPDSGSVGCLTFDQASQAFDQDLSKVAKGDVVGPITYSQAEGSAPVYLVLRIEQTDGLTMDEAAPLLEESVPDAPESADPTAFDDTDARAKVFSSAEIDVNPLFGRWSEAGTKVVPPAVPSDGIQRYESGTGTSTTEPDATAGS